MADLLTRRALRPGDRLLIDDGLPARVLRVLADDLVRVLIDDGQEVILPRVSVALRHPELEGSSPS